MRPITMLQAQWRADTQTGEMLHFEKCKGGFFSSKEELGLKVVGKTRQDEAPTMENPVPVKCVKAGTKIRVYGKNIFDAEQIVKDSNSSTVTIVDNAAMQEWFPNETITEEKGLKVKTGPSFAIYNLHGMTNKRLTTSVTWRSIDERGNALGMGYVYSDGNIQKITSDTVSGQTIDRKTVISNKKGPKRMNISHWTFERNAVIYLSETQLEVGRVATDFEPCTKYCEIEVPCDLYEGDIWYPSCGKVVKVNKTLVFGDDVIDLVSSYDTDDRWDSYYLCWEPQKTEPCSCSHMPHQNSDEAEVGYFNATENAFAFYFKTGMSLDEFKEYLRQQNAAGNPMKIIYQPMYEDEWEILSFEPQPIFALKGVVNVLQEPKELVAQMSATMPVLRYSGIFILPAEYQQVEYIESTGSQYINTGVILTEKHKVILDFQTTDRGNALIFGSRSSATENNFTVTNNGNEGIFIDYCNYMTSRFKGLDAGNNYRLEISKNKISINATEYTPAYSAFTCPAAAYIFYGSGNQWVTEKSKMRLYVCDIYNDEELIRSYTPCYRKADGEIGIYDTVNGVFYANSGTGTFLKGDDV